MPVLKTKPECPNCGEILDGFTSMVDGAEPQVGDLTICVYCRCTLEFTEDMMLINATEETLQSVHKDQLERAQNILKLLKVNIHQSEG